MTRDGQKMLTCLKIRLTISIPIPEEERKLTCIYFHTSLWRLKRFYEGLKGHNHRNGFKQLVHLGTSIKGYGCAQMLICGIKPLWWHDVLYKIWQAPVN